MRFSRYVLLQYLPLSCLALLEETFVDFTSTTGSLNIVNASILYSSDDSVGIRIAADSLASDYEEITGIKHESRNVSLTNTTRTGLLGRSTLKSAIIVGSVNSTLIRRLSSNSSFDISDIQGKWETFKTAIMLNPIPGIEKALVIAGSDKRGAIFGIHTLAEQSGQSPYHWFADVPAKKHSEIYALPKTTVHGEPSVKYRGLFINDEEPALTTWWGKQHGTAYHPLDTEFYGHVFDLLLRLKANYLWPAMWKSFTPPPGNIFFTDDPGNQQLADDYGVVVSTSHHEPMQRATNEWNESVTGPWDWMKNKDNVTKFMDYGVRRAGHNETYFTLGMRGPGDSALEGGNAIEILTDVFKVQRGIFKKYYGAENAANQVWTIYKEVATYYAAGLNPPDDVTLIFPDDNFGNVQRLPTGNESSRAGGIGLYFHLEYVGVPKSYKWQNTNNLPKILKELSHAQMRGCNRIWVINVADIKPMELPFGFIMDLAWNASKFSSDTIIPMYLKAYAAREFEPDHADEIAAVLMEHSHLIGMRRYEHVTPSTYSVFNFHEVERVLSRWQNLAAQAESLYAQMPVDVKPAFYQLVYYPVVSGATYYAVQLGLAINKEYAIERRNSANQVASHVLDDFDKDYDLVERYDNLLGGKWAGIMSQAKFDQTDRPPYGSSRDWSPAARDMLPYLSYVQLRQNMEISLGNMGIYAEESLTAANQGRWAESVDASLPATKYTPTVPVMTPYGPTVQTFDLFMRGDYRVPMNWTLEKTPVSWLSITPTNGVLTKSQPDQRLNVTIDWTKVPVDFDQTVRIGITANPSRYPYFDYLNVPVQNSRVPSDFEGFPDAAGISIEGPHFQRSSAPIAGNVSFQTIPYLGTRSESGSLALRPYVAARSTDSPAAWVEYDIYLFARVSSLNATIYINACLDTDPNLLMEYSLTLDSAPAKFTRLLGNPHTEGDTPPEWRDQVMDQVWTRTVPLGAVEPGRHTLRWSVNSPEVYLEKIVLRTRGAVKDSYLGPPETMIVRSMSEEVSSRVRPPHKMQFGLVP